MRGSDWIRQVHRWLSIAFIAGVSTFIFGMQRGRPAAWIGLLALMPFVALLLTGLYLFVLPYAIGVKSGRSRGSSALGQ